MCGRVKLSAKVLDTADIAVPGVTAPVLAVLKEHAKTERLQMCWGFVEPWTRNELIYNARIESVAEKSMFRAAYRTRRCALAVDAFYEAGKWVRLKSGEPMYLAGIYRWSLGRGEFTILTQDARDHLHKVHPRMPFAVTDLRAWCLHTDLTHWGPEHLEVSKP